MKENLYFKQFIIELYKQPKRKNKNKNKNNKRNHIRLAIVSIWVSAVAKTDG